MKIIKVIFFVVALAFINRSFAQFYHPERGLLINLMGGGSSPKADFGNPYFDEPGNASFGRILGASLGYVFYPGWSLIGCFRGYDHGIEMEFVEKDRI